MNRRSLLAVAAILLLSASAAAPLLDQAAVPPSEGPPLNVDRNDVCALGTSCYPRPLIVQVVSSYEIQVPSPRSSVRFAVQVDSGAAAVYWLANGRSIVEWQASAGQQSLVDETVPVLSGTNYTLTVKNTSDSPSLVGISIW